MNVIFPKRYVNCFATSEVESRLQRLKERPCAGVVLYDAVQQSPMSWKLLADPDRQLFDSSSASLVSIALGINDKSEEMALSVMVRLLRVLIGLHSRDVVHGLLGPDTVFTHTRTGELYIAEAPLTLSLFPTTSPEYKRRASVCAPELLCHEEPTAQKTPLESAPWQGGITSDPRLRIHTKSRQRLVTPAADVWGCAIVILSMLLPLKGSVVHPSSASRPSSGTPPQQTLASSCGGTVCVGPQLMFDREDCEDADVMCPLFSTISPGVVSVLVRCLKRDPEQRPSVEELLCELDPSLRVERMSVMQRLMGDGSDVGEGSSEEEEEEVEEEDETEEEEEDEEEEDS